MEQDTVARDSAVVEPATSIRIPRIDHWFYIGVGIFVVLLSIAGFAPSVVSPPSRTVPLPFTLPVAVHALFGSAWVLLFLLQAVLVATRRTNLHRRVGVAGAVIAVAFVITGCWMFVQHAARGFDLSGDRCQVVLQSPQKWRWSLSPRSCCLAFSLGRQSGIAIDRRSINA